MNWIRLIDIAWQIPSRGIHSSLLDICSVICKPQYPWTTPRDIHIEITTKCNLECPLCPRTVALQSANTSEKLARWEQNISIERFREILDQFYELQSVSLHGIGEPLMHPELLEIIEIASSRAIRVRFSTNATLLTLEKSTRLVNSGLTQLIISLDGSTTESFEKLRENASFEKVLQNIKTLINIRNQKNRGKLAIIVNTVISKHNMEEIDQLIKLMAEIGINQMMLSDMSAPVATMKQYTLDDGEWETVLKKARKAAVSLGIKLHINGRLSLLNTPQSVFKCTRPWLASMIKINGGVTACCNIHDPLYDFGNVTETPFRMIWKNNKYGTFRQSIKKMNTLPVPCQHCHNIL